MRGRLIVVWAAALLVAGQSAAATLDAVAIPPTIEPGARYVPDWGVIDGVNSWLVAGGNLADSHSDLTATEIPPTEVGKLTQKWVFTTSNDVSATPTLEPGALYVPDWGGWIYRLDPATGQKVWADKLSTYTGNVNSLTRSSPAVTEKYVIVGDEASGTVIAIDKNTGALVWRSVIDPSPAALITASPTVVGNLVLVGSSSVEEGLAQLRTGYVPSFRGMIAMLDRDTGMMLWNFRTVPVGYTGGAVWASSFAIDQGRLLLYATTGNNYTVPEDVTACLQKASGAEAQSACLSPDDHIDSIVALDLLTGKLRWARRMIGFDTYVNSCIVSPAKGIPCPDPAGPDYDFGAGPNLFVTTIDGVKTELVGAGQKSGVYWALDAVTGDTVWATQVGPGGRAGGIMWGTAADGEHVYAAINDGNATPYTLATGNKSWKAGSWAGLDAATGKILWQVPATGQNPLAPSLAAGALGAVSAASGVVYAGSMSGDMVALDGASGSVLWKFASGGSVICGPSIVGNTVYWGSGYRRFGTGNDKVFAFSVPGG